MPMKTGSSHGLAVLTCTVLAALLIDVIRPEMPRLVDHFSRLVDSAAGWTGAPVDARFAGVTLLASTLAFVWGVVFHLGRRR